MLQKIVSKLKNPNFTFSALVYILLFIFLLYPYRDYDWGWHYRLGEYFIKNGRMMLSDPYSWTMEGYVWSNHEWLYQPFHYVFFNTFSFLGMSIAGAVLSLLWFYLGIKRYDLSYWQKAILAFVFANLIGGVVWQGLRVQMVGTTFLAVLIYLIPNIRTGHKKTLMLLPFMFLLWANIHGYFIMGMCLFGIVLLSQVIIEFKNHGMQKDGRVFIPKPLCFGIASFFACFAATLANPFTYHIYLEGLRHLSNPLLKYILEWVPFSWDSSFALLILLYSIFIAGFFIKRRKISDLPYIFIFLFMMYYAIVARRYVATYAVVTLPIAAMFFKRVPFHFEKYKTTVFLFLICCLIGFEIGIFRRIPNYHLLHYTFHDYCKFGSNCSEGLVAYLKKNPPKGKGLNFYDWGGYFIGRGVPAKLFIDGRMHLWTDPKTGFQPFLAYQRMYYEKDYELFNKYDFDWLIISTKSPLFEKIASVKDLGMWTVKFADSETAYLVRVR